jgi:hypothetical protein
MGLVAKNQTMHVPMMGLSVTYGDVAPFPVCASVIQALNDGIAAVVETAVPNLLYHDYASAVTTSGDTLLRMMELSRKDLVSYKSSMNEAFDAGFVWGVVRGTTAHSCMSAPMTGSTVMQIYAILRDVAAIVHKGRHVVLDWPTAFRALKNARTSWEEDPLAAVVALKVIED